MNQPEFTSNIDDESQQQPNIIFPNQMQLNHQSSSSQNSSPSHQLQYQKLQLHQPNLQQVQHKSRKHSSISNQADFTTHFYNLNHKQSDLQIHPQPRQRKKSSTYQEKVDLFHLQKASQMKRNMFAQQQNLSPTLHKNQAFSFKPYQQQIFEPNNQQERNRQLQNDRFRQANKNRTGQVKIQNIYVDDSSNNVLAHQSLQQIMPVQSASNIIKPTIIKSTFEFIRQNSCGSYYHPIYTIRTKQGEILASARKQSFHFNSYYNIKLKDENVVGILRGNFGGTQFNFYMKHQQKQEITATILYQTIFSCNSSYRKIQIYFMPNKNHNLLLTKESQYRNLKQLYQDGYSEIKKLITKEPTWNQQRKQYSLPFGGKAKMSSIKNMILINQKQINKKSIVFCKTSINTFHLQIQTDINLPILMGILLSSFDFKLFCE